jgi:hypothetical protein
MGGPAIFLLQPAADFQTAVVPVDREIGLRCEPEEKPQICRADNQENGQASPCLKDKCLGRTKGRAPVVP